MGAGGLSASASTSIASKSGDLSAGLTLPFQYNGAFQVGGSGSLSQSNQASQDASGSGPGGSNMALYIVGGAIALIGLVAIVSARR